MKSAHSIRILPATGLLLLSVSLPVLAVPGKEGGGDVPREETAATAELKLDVRTFATAPQVKNGTALTIDDQGRVYVCETYRWTKGVEDNRWHTWWIMDDLAVNSLADRRAMFTKFAANFAPDYFTAETDRVMRLLDTTGDGKADTETEFASEFRDAVDGPAIGLLPALNDPTKMYLACSPKVWLLTDSDLDGKAEKREVIADGLGIRTSFSGHDLHGLTWGPDGMLYFSLGDRGYDIKTKEGTVLHDANTGAVFRCQPDGSGLEVYYHGLRNPQELAFNELGDLFTGDNNCDQGDEARITWVIEGGESGWSIGHQALTSYKAYIHDGGFGQVPHWLSENLWKTPHEGQPLWITPPLKNYTNGPSGLVFTSGLSLTDRYHNSFFLCDYKGSASQSFLYNFKVQPHGAGYEVVDAHLFHRGVPNSDVDFGPDGTLYLLDFGGGWGRSEAGNIYTISSAEGLARPVVTETRDLLKAGLGSRSIADLLPLLGHADQRIRQRAQYALAGRGAEAVKALTEATGSLTGLAQLHALWTLGQLRAAEPVRAFLTNGSAELRAQAARTLGTLRDTDSLPALRALLADEAPRPRVFAAIALGRMADSAAADAAVAMVERQGTGDAFQRHAGVMAFTGCLDGPALAALSAHRSPAVRLTAVLALRRQADAGCAAFLHDADPAVAQEAIRAIGDLPIVSASAALGGEARHLLDGTAPDYLKVDAHYRRILRALQTDGTADSAAVVADLAASDKLSEDQRLLAIRTLANFAAPPPLDPVMGVIRPLPARDATALRPAVESRLAPLFTKASGKLTAAALPLVTLYDLALPEATLTAWATDAAQPMDLRVAAVSRMSPLAARPFLSCDTAELRAAAAPVVVAVAPGAAGSIAGSLIRQGTAADLRAAYALLANAGTGAAPLLVSELERLAAGQVPAPVRLDLVEAASARQEPAVKEKLAAYESQLAGDGHSVLDFTLAGGDPVRGEEVFNNQGTCLKCHRIEGAGGNAGPKLAGLAALRKPAEILESVVNPGAVIVPGYGMTVLTLADGSVLAATPVADDPDTKSDPALQTFRTADGLLKRIPKTDIREQTPPVSPMPPLGLSLPRRDLRDLISFLLTLDKAPIESK